MSESREQFEKWLRTCGYVDNDLRRDDIGRYRYTDTESAWRGFEAGRLAGLEEAAKKAPEWHKSTARVKTWRRKHPKDYAKRSRKYYDQFRDGAKRHRQDWAIWEIELLDSELSDRQICAKLQRKMRAIYAKRYKLKGARAIREIAQEGK